MCKSARLLTHSPTGSPIISSFYVGFSSGRAFFYCPPCVFVSIFPFISPTENQYSAVKHFQFYRIYAIINNVISQKSKRKVKS
jgi:hypothetical protein